MRLANTAKLVITAAMAISVAACERASSGGSESSSAAAKQAIASEEANSNRAFHNRDLNALVAPYASKAVFILPGMPPQVGTAAIRNAYSEALKDPKFDVSFAADKVEVARSGDLAFTQGHFTMKGSDPKTEALTTSTGSYLTIFKKQPDGSWKIIEDWAAANPPPQGK